MLASSRTYRELRVCSRKSLSYRLRLTVGFPSRLTFTTRPAAHRVSEAATVSVHRCKPSASRRRAPIAAVGFVLGGHPIVAAFFGVGAVALVGVSGWLVGQAGKPD